MNSIAEIYQLVNSGTPLADVIPAGADLAWWERRLSSYNPSAKTRKPRKQAKRERSRKGGYFAQVARWNLSTAELVSRVNRKNEIPFDGYHPDDSGDESTNEARLGFPARW